MLVSSSVRQLLLLQQKPKQPVLLFLSSCRRRQQRTFFHDNQWSQQRQQQQRTFATSITDKKEESSPTTTQRKASTTTTTTTTAPQLQQERQFSTISKNAVVEPSSTATPTKTPTPSPTSTWATSTYLPSMPVVGGVALSAGTALAGFQVAGIVSEAMAVPLSGIPVAILLGMAMKNTVGVSSTIQPGITFSTKTILQGGIVAVAAKLSFVELLTTGTQGLPVVIGAVGAGLTIIPQLGRLAGLPTKMSLLLTAGTSICGVTAITALAPAIQADNRDIAVAVANTVAFGTIGMLCYPYLFHALCTSPEQVGLCLGVGIHDTSQVLGSAMSYSEIYGEEMALKVAAITKLTRNLGLAVAIPGLTYMHAMEQQKVSGQNTQEQLGDSISGLNTFSQYVPTFLWAFLGMSTIRSGGDLLFADHEAFSQTMNFIGNDLSKYALGTAMAGVGLSTSASSLKGVGWKPFAVGASGALVVGGTGFTIASMMV